MWWKTYADPSEPYFLFRKHSLGGLWTVGYLLALCGLVAIFGADMLPQLSVPIALGGLYVFLSYVTGIVGMIVFAPIIAYAWICLDWLITYGAGAANQLMALEGLLCAMLIVVFLIGAPHVRANLLIPVVCEGFVYGILSISSYNLLVLGPQVGETMTRARQVMETLSFGFLWATVAVAVIVLVIVLTASVRSKEEKTEVKRQLKGDLLLLAAGLVPPVVGSLLSRLNPVLGMLVLLALYAGLAYFAQLKGIKRVCWALVPLVVLATLAVIAQAPLDTLPTWQPGAVLLHAVHDGPLGSVATACALPLLEGVDQALGSSLRGMLQWGIGLLSWFGDFAQALVVPAINLLKQAQQTTGLPETADAQQVTDLIWSIETIPEKASVAYLLALYLLTFLASVIMGTIVGVGDIRAYAAKREKRVDAGQEAAEMPAQSSEMPDAALATDDAEAAESHEPQLLPNWITGASLSKLLSREDAESTETVPNDGDQAVPSDASDKRRIGLPRNLLSRELRLALGLPVAKRLGRRRWHNWDEQLSGAVPRFEGVHVNRASIRNLTTQLKRPIGKGLWWKVYEDDGRMELIPKGGMLDFIIVWAPLIAVLRTVPTDVHASLMVPIMIILSVMGVCHVLGLLGTTVSGPMLVYGWSALMWHLGQSGATPMTDTETVIMAATIFGLLIIFSAFTASLQRGAGWTIALVFYGAGAAWLSGQRFATGAMDELTVRTYLGYIYLASMAVAVVFTLWALFKEALLLRRWPEARADELTCVVLALVGIVPVAIAGVLSGAGSLLALVGATAAYVALAVVGRMRSPKGLSCLLLPLYVGAMAWSLTAIDATLLPPSAMTDRLVSMCGGGPLAFMAQGAQTIMEGCTKLLEGPVRAAVLFVLNLANDNPVSAEAIAPELVQVLCLFVGILVIASLMGVGVSVIEGVRPELVEAVLDRERRVLDALTPSTPDEKAPSEEVPATEAAPEEAPAVVATIEEPPTMEAPIEETPADEGTVESAS